MNNIEYLLSPIIMTLDIHYNMSLMSCSIKTGAMFSPPAVMINSFNLPVI